MTNTNLAPFHTDAKTANALVSVAKKHCAQPMNGCVSGVDAANVTTQYQNTCQFKLCTGWHAVKQSTSIFAASAFKITPCYDGTYKRAFQTTIYAYGEKPDSTKHDIVAATRRANKWVLLVSGGTSAPPADALTVPVFYPARQWTSKLPIDGKENKRLWCNANDPLHTFGTWFMNACGLTNEGTKPLPVMVFDGTTVRQKMNGNSPLYYQNVKLSVTEKFAQVDTNKTQWKLLFDNGSNVPLLTASSWQTTGFTSSYIWLCHLASLDGKTTSLTKVDFSDQWQTTTDSSKALKRGHQAIAPHTVIGYSLANECTYKSSGNKTIKYEEDAAVLTGSALTLSMPVLVPIIKTEITNQPIIAEVEIDLYEITEGDEIDGLCGQNTAVEKRKLETTEDMLGGVQGTLFAYIPDYQNSKPLAKGTVSIENTCEDKPLLGLWKDGIFPQLLLCENIPYGFCIPLKKIECLTRVSGEDCAPMYSLYKYVVGLGTIGSQSIYQPLNVDWLPSYGSCID